MKLDINKLEGLKESHQSFVMVLGREHRVIIVFETDTNKDRIYLDGEVLFSYEKQEERFPSLKTKESEPYLSLTLKRKHIDTNCGVKSYTNNFSEDQINYFKDVSQLFGVWDTSLRKMVKHSNNIYVEQTIEVEPYEQLYLFGDNNRIGFLTSSPIVSASCSFYLDGELAFLITKSYYEREILYGNLIKIRFNLEDLFLPDNKFIRNQLTKHKEVIFKKVDNFVYIQA